MLKALKKSLKLKKMFCHLCYAFLIVMDETEWRQKKIARSSVSSLLLSQFVKQTEAKCKSFFFSWDNEIFLNTILAILYDFLFLQ